jgi:hypothetical protein
VVVAHRRFASLAMVGPAQRDPDVLAARAYRLGDRVARRCVRDDVGQSTDGDERGRGHPPVDSPQTGQSRITRNVSSVSPHPSW